MNLNGLTVSDADVRMLGDRVLLRELPQDALSLRYGTLWLPQQAEDAQRLLHGEVVAVGPLVRDVRVGMRVGCSRYSRVPLDRDGVYWVTTEDALQYWLSEG